jgi:hypothetical protein
LLAREEAVGCGAAGEAEGAAHEGALEEGGHVCLLWVVGFVCMEVCTRDKRGFRDGRAGRSVEV